MKPYPFELLNHFTCPCIDSPDLAAHGEMKMWALAFSYTGGGLQGLKQKLKFLKVPRHQFTLRLEAVKGFWQRKGCHSIVGNEPAAVTAFLLWPVCGVPASSDDSGDLRSPHTVPFALSFEKEQPRNNGLVVWMSFCHSRRLSCSAPRSFFWPSRSLL